MDVYFMALKHHLSFMATSLHQFSLEEEGVSQLLAQLKRFGERGVSDVYCGRESVEAILEKARDFLNQKGIEGEEDLKRLLEQEGTSGRRGEYLVFTIGDGTPFVLRHYPQPPFAHIHPARQGPNLMRIRVTLLKTALLSLLYSLRGRKWDLECVNLAREQLALSPVPAISQALESLVNLLRERLSPYV